MTNSKLWIAMVVVTIIAVGGYFAPARNAVQATLGGMPFLEVQYFQKGLAIDSRGTVLKKVLTGTGTLIYSNSSVTASTTKAFDIAVSGVTVNDNVFVQTATTTAASLGWHIQGASASSTSGYITVIVANLTGATGNVPRDIASSTNYLVIQD